jgi:hypothetical protein
MIISALRLGRSPDDGRLGLFVEISIMHTLPATGYLRLYQIIGNPKADPPIPPLIPVGYRYSFTQRPAWRITRTCSRTRRRVG